MVVGVGERGGVVNMCIILDAMWYHSILTFWDVCSGRMVGACFISSIRGYVCWPLRCWMDVGWNVRCGLFCAPCKNTTTHQPLYVFSLWCQVAPWRALPHRHLTLFCVPWLPSCPSVSSPTNHGILWMPSTFIMPRGPAFCLPAHTFGFLLYLPAMEHVNSIILCYHVLLCSLLPTVGWLEQVCGGYSCSRTYPACSACLPLSSLPAFS